MGKSCFFLILVFGCYTSFFYKISAGKTIDVLSRLNPCPILDVDRLRSALLYINTFKDILLVKLAALSFCNTCCNISYLT